MSKMKTTMDKMNTKAKETLSNISKLDTKTKIHVGIIAGLSILSIGLIAGVASLAASSLNTELVNKTYNLKEDSILKNNLIDGKLYIANGANSELQLEEAKVTLLDEKLQHFDSDSKDDISKAERFADRKPKSIKGILNRYLPSKYQLNDEDINTIYNNSNKYKFSLWLGSHSVATQLARVFNWNGDEFNNLTLLKFATPNTLDPSVTARLTFNRSSKTILTSSNRSNAFSSVRFLKVYIAPDSELYQPKYLVTQNYNLKSISVDVSNTNGGIYTLNKPTNAVPTLTTFPLNTYILKDSITPDVLYKPSGSGTSLSLGEPVTNNYVDVSDPSFVNGGSYFLNKSGTSPPTISTTSSNTTLTIEQKIQLINSIDWIQDPTLWLNTGTTARTLISIINANLADNEKFTAAEVGTILDSPTTYKFSLWVGDRRTTPAEILSRAYRFPEWSGANITTKHKKVGAYEFTLSFTRDTTGEGATTASLKLEDRHGNQDNVYGAIRALFIHKV